MFGERLYTKKSSGDLRVRKRSSASLRALITSARRFGSAQDGNIAMLFATMTTLVFMFVGGAIDYSRWNAIRADLLESLDASALAVSQITAENPSLTDDEIKSFGRQFFLENFNYETQLISGWEMKFDISSGGIIEACVDGDVKTMLLPVVQIDKLVVDKCTEITPQGAGRIELAMVLDVTGSMGWNDDSGAYKMGSLKSAVTELLDVLFEGDSVSDNVRIGVVPFNQHVNAGGASSWNDSSWGDVNGEALYNGARFFHVDNTGAIDMSTKVNHYTLYASDPDREWDGCVEARPYPLDELDYAPGSSISAGDITTAMTVPSSADEPDTTMRDAFVDMPDISNGNSASDIANIANTRFVPVFLPDEADCGYSYDCVYGTSGTTNGYNWYGYWFDDPDDVSGIWESSYSNRNYVNDYRYTRYYIGEPFEKYVPIAYAIRMALYDEDFDQELHDWLEFYGATNYGTDEFIGRIGYPGWYNPITELYEYKYDQPKGSSSAGPNPDDCPDPIVPLTGTRSTVEDAVNALQPDGGTNIPNGAMWGWRVVSPGAPFTESIGPGESGPGGTTDADWSKAVVIMTDGFNDFADNDYTHWGSYISAYGYEIEERMGDGIDEADSGSSNMEDEADNKLLRICRRMKQEEILVYTIVFDVSSGSNIETIMKSCATEPAEPYFYNAADGADLEEAFGDIADDLVKLHVSK